MTGTHSDKEQAAIAEAKALLGSGRFADAIALLGSVAPSVDSIYVIAVCQRKLNRHDAALATLQQLIALKPSFARAFQEQGYNYQAIGKSSKATTAFQQAVALNPALIMSWNALALTYKTNNMPSRASHALRQYTFLYKLPRELQSSLSLFYEKKFYKAEQICRHYLQQNPKNVEGMRLLAKLGVELKIMDDAEFLLESSVEFEPEHFPARVDYAMLLLRRQKFEKALQQAELLIGKKPDDVQLNIILADSLVGVGRPEEALDIYTRVLEKNPDSVYSSLTLGHAQKTLGKIDEAVLSYQNAYRIKPDFGDAYWSLANLKTYTFSDDELENMQTLEATEDTAVDDRIHFCFAIGKCFEDRGQYDESFDYYERGNALKNQGSGYPVDVMDRRFHSHIEVCTPELFAAKDKQGYPDPAPIFIVGLPRAGSTLLEQILASHSQIDGTMELPNILGLAYKLQGRRRLDEEQRYPAILNDLKPDQLHGFGEKFINETRVYRGDAPFFIDKMPNNFIHIGLLHLILPNAKIIDARRHPMACCFSGFKQLFGEGQDFSYGLLEIGRYYRSYVELMDHWDRVLPGKILRVQYEDVVSDLQTEVERILDYCGLPFEQACIEYHKNKRDIRTPSAEQVRQPIYSSGLEQWRNYESHLGPLREALGDDVLARFQ